MGERPDPGARPVSPPGREPDAEPVDVELDVRREVCPYPFLMAKLALEPLAAGQLLRVVVGNEASARDVPRALRESGHQVVAAGPAGPGLWAITVRKRGG